MPKYNIIIKWYNNASSIIIIEKVIELRLIIIFMKLREYFKKKLNKSFIIKQYI
jgi:hypothetical protein